MAMRIDDRRVDAIASVEEAVSVVEEADRQIGRLREQRKRLDEKARRLAGYRDRAMRRLGDGSLLESNASGTVPSPSQDAGAPDAQAQPFGSF